MFEEEEKDGVAVGRVLLPLNDQCHLDSKDYVTVWNVLRGKGVVVVELGRVGGRVCLYAFGQSGLEGL